MKNDSLLYACYINDINQVKEKLKSVKMTHLKESTQEMGTPLHAAALNENKEIVDLLLDAGANIEQGNFLGDNAMLTCIKKGKLDMARYLLEKESDVNKKGCQNRNSLSQLILYSWNLSFAEYLVGKGCIINTTSQDKISLLRDAAGKNNTEALHFLIEKGIEKSYMNNAMCWSIIYNSTQALRSFLEMGADLNTMYDSCKGIEKSLYHGCLASNSRGDRTEMIQLLIEAGVNFKQIPQRAVSLGIDKTKLSPYDYAIAQANKYPDHSEFIMRNIALIDKV